MKKRGDRGKFYAVSSFEIKAKDDTKRTFRGLLSTSHIDHGNGLFRDIVHPGAFKRTLDHFRSAKDAYIPLVDTHKYDSIFHAYGHMIEGEEVLTGKVHRYDREDGGTLEVPEMLLETEWQVIDGIDGERVLDRIRPGSVRKMSMGYTPYGAPDFVNLRGYGKTRNLREVGLEEGSLVLFPMNPRAELATVKNILEAVREGKLSPEVEEELRSLSSEDRERFRALLDSDPPEQDSGTPEDTGLAPEDPRRLELEELARDLALRSLGA